MSDDTQFEEGESYEIASLPDNEMNHSGKLEWVDDNTLALAHGDQVVEFEFSHVRCTDVKYLDKETGDLYETRGEMNDE